MQKNRIREHRQQIGLSQTKLAGRAGVAESTLSDIELGKRQAWPKIRKALANALNVPERELFPED